MGLTISLTFGFITLFTLLFHGLVSPRLEIQTDSFKNTVKTFAKITAVFAWGFIMAVMIFFVVFWVFMVFDLNKPYKDVLVSSSEYSQLAYAADSSEWTGVTAQSETESFKFKRKCVEITESANENFIVEQWNGTSKILGIDVSTYVISIPSNKVIEYVIHNNANKEQSDE